MRYGRFALYNADIVISVMVPDSRYQKTILSNPHPRAALAAYRVALPRAARLPQRAVAVHANVHDGELPFAVLALLEGVVRGRRQREPPLRHEHILVLDVVAALRDHRPEVGRLEGKRDEPLVVRHVEEGLGGHPGARGGLDRFEGVVRLGWKCHVVGRFEAALRRPGPAEAVFGEIVAS